MTTPAPTTPSSDEGIVRRLNEEYIRAFMQADVAWYVQHLTDEFMVIESDGSLLNKQQFLAATAKGPDVATYKLDQVSIRFYGDVALVQATGLWTRKDGSAGMSRYIDTYVRMNKEWKVVAAQVTRANLPQK